MALPEPCHVLWCEVSLPSSWHAHQHQRVLTWAVINTQDLHPLHGHTAHMSKRPYTSHVQIYRDFFAIGHGCTAHSSPIRIHCKNCSLGSQTNWPAVSPILQYWLSSRLRWARSKHCCWRTVSLEWTLILLLTKSILTVLMTLSPSLMELSELLPRVLLRMSRRVVSLWGL